MLSRAVVRWVAGLAGVVGGLAFVGYTVVQARLPEGCVDTECDTHPMRPNSTTANTLLVIGMALVLVCGLGLLAELRSRHQLGRLGRAGGIVLGAGFAFLAAAAVAGALTDAEWNGMPALVIPGVLGLAVGLLLLGLTVLRSRLLPVWSGALLLLGAVLLPFSNEENSTILRDIPFGVAWAVVGVLLVRLAHLETRPAEERQLVA